MKRVELKRRLEPIFYVYEHWRPDISVCFYVGKGKKYRAYSFINRKSHIPIIWELASCGLEIEVRIIKDGLTEKAAFDIERQQIAFWRSIGVVLLNKTDGGEGASGLIRTEESKKLISEIRKGWEPSDVTRLRMSLSATKRMKDPQVRLNVSIKNTGRKHTDDECTKISIGLTGKKRVFTPEHCENLRIAGTKRKNTPQQNANIGKAMRGRKILWSDKISLAQKGKPRPYVKHGFDGRFLKKAA